MSERLLHIRESIAVAQKIESESHALRDFLHAKRPYLHPSISLPNENSLDALQDFVTHYIERVPNFIEALTDVCQSAGIYEMTKIFLQMAEDYFLKPPDVIAEHTGMQALIDEAYLAHRLVEEVNDRVMMNCGVPLTPMDMTISNIVIHDLLGEEFANQLDLAVYYSIESFFQTNEIFNDAKFKEFMEIQKQDGGKAVLQKWPCLAGDSAISLDLTH